jgi:Ca2+-binding RTX toxin-like protein
MPLISELTDAPADSSTPYTIAPGDGFVGELVGNLDRDWVRVTLTTGIEYQFTVWPTNYLGGVFQSSFQLLEPNGGTLISASYSAIGSFPQQVVTFTAQAGGTYYVNLGTPTIGGMQYWLSLDALDYLGTPGDDFLYGNAFDERLNGFAGNDLLFGSSGDDTLSGGDGNDRLDGGDGNDVLDGGLGNDRYIIYEAGDVIRGEVGYSQGGGIDTVESWISYFLPSNVEILRLMGTANLNGAGGFAPEALVGQAGDNVLDGGGGNDVITAKAGNDTLIGGVGADTLVGDAGNDVFLFRSIFESRPGQANRDFINGFVNGEDKIDLSGIDANINTTENDAFFFIDSVAFHGIAGEMRFFTFGGGNYNIVEADVDGDGSADMQIFVNLTNEMLPGDFIL